MDYTNEAELKMMDAIEVLDRRLSQIRAGRANPNMLNNIMVDAYGSNLNIKDVANITVPESRELFIRPFDKTLLKNIEKSIMEANLGLTPTNNGEVIILTLPELTEDKRREYVKEAKKIGEEAKIALRNVRQNVNNEIKKGELREDEEKALLEDIQELINKFNKTVDEKIKEKENELLKV